MRYDWAANKCRWCNSDCVGSFCGSECEERYNRFEKYAHRYVLLFFAGIIAPIFLLILNLIFNWMTGSLEIGLTFAILGATVTVFPFCTPETFYTLGVKGTIRLSRELGLCMFSIGMAVTILCLVFGW